MSEDRELAGPVVGLVAQCVQAGYELPALSIDPGGVSGSILDYELSDATDLSFSVDAAGSLLIEAKGLNDHQGRPARHPNHTQCDFNLGRGRIEARWAHAPRTRFHGDGKCDATFSLERWSWTSGRSAVVWICEIEGHSPWRGNLDVRSTRGRSYQTGEFYEGAGMRLLVVPKNSERDSSWLIIEVEDGMLSSERVRDALLALSFVLSFPCQVAVLVGVDADYVPVQALHIHGPLKARPSAGRPPIPHVIRLDQRWHGELFRLLIERMTADGDSDTTYLLRQSYLDVDADHLEGAHLKLHVALEAFCSRAVKVPPRDRAEKVAWNRWVDEQRTSIRELAVTPRAAESLEASIRGLWRQASSNHIENFFSAHDVVLPKELRTLLRSGRNLAAHSFRILEKSSADFEEELDRIASVQTVAVAALALHIGFAGPIADGRGATSAPSWWPHQDPTAPHGHWVRCTIPSGTQEGT